MIKKYLSFILMLLAAVFIFVFKSNIGLVLAIISLILSIVYIKEKNTFNIIALIGSIILVVYSIISFVMAFNFTNGLFNKAKQDAVNAYADSLEYSVESKIDTLINNNEVKDGENILTEDLFKKYNLKYPEKCESYVIVNIDLNDNKNNTYEAYVRCDNKYATEGFNDNYLK